MKKFEFTVGEAELARALKLIGIGGYEHNAHFVEDRKWELDFYWREAKTSVEVMGGLWRRGKGAHRGLGQRRDYEKMNRCVMEGIKVLQFSTEMVRENPIGCAEMVKVLLEGSNG